MKLELKNLINNDKFYKIYKILHRNLLRAFVEILEWFSLEDDIKLTNLSIVF